MEEKVLEFAARYTGIPIGQLSINHEMEEDLGLYGLDAIGFVEQFFEEFNIVNPEDCNLDQYLTAEGLGDMGLMIRSIFSKKARTPLRTTPLPLYHLIHVAEHKTWTDYRA